MELKHDWKALNDVLFYKKPANVSGQNIADVSSVVLLEDRGKVIDGVASNGRTVLRKDMQHLNDSALSKDALDGIASAYAVDQAVVLSKRDLDQFVIEAAAIGTNYYQQLQDIRKKLKTQLGRGREGVIISRRHFVLDLFGDGLKRILPRKFNVLIFVDERPAVPPSQQTQPLAYRAILLCYENGQLDQFYEPDFSSLHGGRLHNWQNEAQAIGQYLESRYILPCFGIFMHQDDWEDCQAGAAISTPGVISVVGPSSRPWRRFVRHYDAGKAAVYPNRTLAKVLLTWQRIMVSLGRY